MTMPQYDYVYNTSVLQYKLCWWLVCLALTLLLSIKALQILFSQALL